MGLLFERAVVVWGDGTGRVRLISQRILERVGMSDGVDDAIDWSVVIGVDVDLTEEGDF